jgi:hypothetical protein
MNQFLNRSMLLLPALLLLVLLSTFGFSGCHQGSKEYQVFEDSVKPHIISLEEAKEYTARYRSTVDSLAAKCPGFKDSFQIGHAEAFNRDCFALLLNQSDSLSQAAGIRIYYGIDRGGVIKLIMVPYDSSGRDIYNHLISVDEKQVPGVSPAHTEALTVSGAQALEMGQMCPPVCPPPPPGGGLNGH